MRQQTCKPFARQNKNKQNGFGICYHFAIKEEMRFLKSECFQGFAAHHIHFFLIPTRLTGDVLGYFSRYSGLLAGSKWRRFSIVSTAFRRRNAKTIPRADYTTVR